MYLPFGIGWVIQKIAYTFEFLTLAIISPRYTIAEWWYDTIDMWS
jgi:hypothetical protein